MKKLSKWFPILGCGLIIGGLIAKFGVTTGIIFGVGISLIVMGLVHE